MEKLTYRELFLRHLDVDPLATAASELSAVAARHGIEDIGLDRRQWLDLLSSLVIQPALPADTLTFIHDYPADQAALARIRPESPPVAERFELYVGNVELANGYQELTDANEQRQRFEADNTQRENLGRELCAVDQHLLMALEQGLPECAGVALGVDRLLMAVCGVDAINEIIAFPHSRA